MRINIFRCPLANAFKDQPRISKAKKSRTGADLFVCQEFRPALQIRRNTPPSPRPGPCPSASRAGATRAVPPPPRQKRVPWLPSRKQTDTRGRVSRWTRAHRAARAQRGARGLPGGPSRAPSRGGTLGARLTCLAQRHRGGQKQQEQRQPGRRRGSQGAHPGGGGALLGGRDLRSARQDEAAAGREALGPAAGRPDAGFGRPS